MTVAQSGDATEPHLRAELLHLPRRSHELPLHRLEPTLVPGLGDGLLCCAPPTLVDNFLGNRLRNGRQLRQLPNVGIRVSHSFRITCNIYTGGPVCRGS
jgi:hypothetical protein